MNILQPVRMPTRDCTATSHSPRCRAMKPYPFGQKSNFRRKAPVGQALLQRRARHLPHKGKYRVRGVILLPRSALPLFFTARSRPVLRRCSLPASVSGARPDERPGDKYNSLLRFFPGAHRGYRWPGNAPAVSVLVKTRQI